MTDADLSSRSIAREPGMTGDYTPGPWLIVGQSIFAITADDRWIATFGDGYPVGPESEANARLISAAPELFEALAGLVLRTIDYEPCWCQEVTIEHFFEYVHEERCARARAAIAKATGASS